MILIFDKFGHFKKWFKEELKTKLPDCEEFEQFWIELMTKIYFERLEYKFEDHLDERQARQNRLLINKIPLEKENQEKEIFRLN